MEIADLEYKTEVPVGSYRATLVAYKQKQNAGVNWNERREIVAFGNNQDDLTTLTRFSSPIAYNF